MAGEFQKLLIFCNHLSGWYKSPKGLKEIQRTADVWTKIPCLCQMSDGNEQMVFKNLINACKWINQLISQLSLNVFEIFSGVSGVNSDQNRSKPTTGNIHLFELNGPPLYAMMILKSYLISRFLLSDVVGHGITSHSVQSTLLHSIVRPELCKLLLTFKMILQSDKQHKCRKKNSQSLILWVCDPPTPIISDQWEHWSLRVWLCSQIIVLLLSMWKQTAANKKDKVCFWSGSNKRTRGESTSWKLLLKSEWRPTCVRWNIVSILPTGNIFGDIFLKYIH